ncbi:MAG: tRNA-specific 2-thiouridylase [Desulfovibrio sp.]|nr:tRNA-specific 2-thiouridylase [Desulfovibrio sp.]
MKIAVAVSGGVDSLCAVFLLHEQGHSLLALHARLLEEDNALESRLAETMARMGIPFVVLDFRSHFWGRVQEKALHAWFQGATPNPCALCNRFIKFGLLFEEAKRRGCEKLATGHYVALKTMGETPLLSSAFDQHKDQSYFLSVVHPSVLPYLSFPLEAMTKDAVKAAVAARGMIIPKKESQDVCFVPKGKTAFASYCVSNWEKMGLGIPEKGPSFLFEGRDTPLRDVGLHKGLWHYTEGQRKGLGIAYTEGLYVLAKRFDTALPSLIIGPRDCLGMVSLRATLLSLFLPYAFWPSTCFVKVRYRQKPVEAHVSLDPSSNELSVRFANPVFPSAKGQILSVSDEEGHILAGGIITSMKHAFLPF